MIEEIMARVGHLSKSEVVRTAIMRYHKSTFPYYKEKEEKKADLEAEHEELLKLPVEEFAKKLFGDIDLTSKPGFVKLRHKNNSAFTVSIPFHAVKNYFSRDEIWLSVDKNPETDAPDLQNK